MKLTAEQRHILHQELDTLLDARMREPYPSKQIDSFGLMFVDATEHSQGRIFETKFDRLMVPIERQLSTQKGSAPWTTKPIILPD